MEAKEKEIFNQTVEAFQEKYPSSNIRIEGTMLVANVYNEDTYTREDQQFNTDGYNLLYCLTMLCRLLKEKLR